MRAADITGQRFGCLVVVGRGVDARYGAARWLCDCDCGESATVPGYRLRSGRTQSCGCLARAATAARSTTHGLSRSPTYATWRAMRDRCMNPRNRRWWDYGGRGIRVCPAWRDSFEAFLADVGPRPQDCTLERIDGNGDYEPGNVRWATDLEQARNRRNNHPVGDARTISEAAERVGVPASTVSSRMRRGWSPEEAVAT